MAAGARPGVPGIQSGLRAVLENISIPFYKRTGDSYNTFADIMTGNF
jgi:hypothetical protein